MNTPNYKLRLFFGSSVCAFAIAICCSIAIPIPSFASPGDPQKAYDDWVAANEAVKEAKKKLTNAEEKLRNVMAVSATGGITEGEQRALAKARAEVAEAEAAVKEAEAQLEAARLELEKAIGEIEDEKLKKEFIRKRDGYIESQRFALIAQGVFVAGNGMQTVTIDTENGKLTIYLPDDIRRGDTLTGTVIAEPKGRTPEELASNNTKLKAYAFKIDDKPLEPFTVTCGEREERPCQQMFYLYHADEKRLRPQLTMKDDRDREVFRATFQLDDPPTPRSNITPNFILPTLGQQGRQIVITGPFDGNSTNTTLRLSQTRRENLGGFGLQLLVPLAESPRKAVFEAPSTFSGLLDLSLKKGTKVTTGQLRNIGVRLSAPKTSLLKGEQTTLKVEVTGLEGLKEPVPLTLASQGVITMQNGVFQALTIQPSQVSSDGTFTTTRQITGVQPGGFTVTATVVVHSFDTCTQDDSVPARVILWNTVTGDYAFRTGASQSPGGTVSPAPPSGTSLVGTGNLVMTGCIITLTHNAPDRRVFASLDTCKKTGSANVQAGPGKATFNITDSSTTNNTCTCPEGENCFQV